MTDDIEKSICQEDLSCPRQQLVGIEGIKSEVKVVAVGLGRRTGGSEGRERERNLTGCGQLVKAGKNQQ